ncbi:hypothetical protein MNBD_ALPHA06-743 [hydrothermal vent metagenome]|uniref:Bacteriophage phiJL001 Gp84 C-terminal domain-containing protein n=1 Tax=hydrothermal vent metagenome TaxID=652676 RepID=A0A3B0S4J9_9ZZZZ
MRNVPASLTAKLQTGVTQLCWCWKFSRKDGQVFGFTDHDQLLNFDNIIWQPSLGLAPGVVETSTGFEAGSAGTAGSILHDALTEDDLKSGKFDGALVEIWRVDWQEPNDRVGIWAGEVGDIRLNDHVFTAELVSNTRKLERSIGRTFAKNCDAELGDSRCTKNISAAPWRLATSIASVLTPGSFTVAGLNLPEKDWFIFGEVAWLDAGKTSNHARIVSHYFAGTAEVFELLLPPAIALQTGDQIELIVGCDKSLSHCSDKFSNVINFRGCPFMPGNDALAATPFVS